MVMPLLRFLLRLTKISIKLSNDNHTPSTFINFILSTSLFTPYRRLPTRQWAFKFIHWDRRQLSGLWFALIRRTDDAGVNRGSYVIEVVIWFGAGNFVTGFGLGIYACNVDWGLVTHSNIFIFNINFGWLFTSRSNGEHFLLIKLFFYFNTK